MSANEQRAHDIACAIFANQSQYVKWAEYFFGENTKVDPYELYASIVEYFFIAISSRDK